MQNSLINNNLCKNNYECAAANCDNLILKLLTQANISYDLVEQACSS